jgi:xanthine dehydrogenase accessory factor
MLNATDISEALARAATEGQALAIVSLVMSGGEVPAELERLLVAEDGMTVGGTLGDRELNEIAARYARRLMTDDKQEIVTSGVSEMMATLDDELETITPPALTADLRLLIEISRPPLELVICGGGHVGRAVALAGRMLDFVVTVIDDRAEFVARDRFPDPNIRLVADDFTRALQSLKITPATHIVIVTRGHRHDELCLQEVIDKPARYLGMIGSRRRTTTIREHLRREGVAADLLRRVHAPIGLDIGAQTPEEIAIAILAEIVLVRRGGEGRPKSASGPMAHAR